MCPKAILGRVPRGLSRDRLVCRRGPIGSRCRAPVPHCKPFLETRYLHLALDVMKHKAPCSRCNHRSQRNSLPRSGSCRSANRTGNAAKSRHRRYHHAQRCQNGVRQGAAGMASRSIQGPWPRQPSCHGLKMDRDSHHPRNESNRASATRHARAAVTHGRDDAAALAMGAFAIGLAEHDRVAAGETFERALALSPSSALTLFLGAVMLAYAGEAERAIDWAERALRLSPRDPPTRGGPFSREWRRNPKPPLTRRLPRRVRRLHNRLF